MSDKDGIIQQRSVQESDASSAIEGANEISTIRGQMTAFVEDTFRGRSKGRFVTQIATTNLESEAALKKMTDKLQDFAKGEKEFASLVDLYDEDVSGIVS